MAAYGNDVVLVSPGAEPRAEIRYAVLPGTASTTTFQKRLRGSSRTETQRSTVRYQFALPLTSVVQLGADGEPHVSTSFGAPTFRGSAQVHATEVGLTSLEGGSVGVRWSDRGPQGRFELGRHGGQPDPNAYPLVQSLMETLVPLPAAAVGAGAVWTQTEPHRDPTGSVVPGLTRETQYSLISHADGQVVLDVASKVTGESPDGGAMKVTSFTNTSQGQWTLDLRQPFPAEVRQEVRGQIQSRTKEGGVFVVDSRETVRLDR